MQQGFRAASGEIALILACLQARYNRGGHNDFLRIACARLSWPTVLSIARSHGIVPLLYEVLLSDQAQIPQKIRTSLQDEFQRSAANSILYAAELARLFGCLEQRGISALAFKGPALAALLYGKLSLRTVRDLDILVAKAQLKPALDVLQVCGYAPMPGLDEGRPVGTGGAQKHVALVHGEGCFKVELHWDIAEPSLAFRFSFDQLWADRENIALLHKPIAILNREDMLLMMCAHGTAHCWGSLKWICDVAQAISALPDLNWRRILARAEVLGCKRMLFVATALARELCGVALPSAVEAGVRSQKVEQLRREFQSRLFVDSEPVVSLERTLIFIRSRERLRDRILIARRFIVPKLRPNARDRALIRLPRYLLLLYFPIRLLRLMLLYWRRAVMPLLRSTADKPHRSIFSPAVTAISELQSRL